MKEMFYRSVFNKPLDKWRPKKLEYTNNMFKYSFFNQDINDWNPINLIETQGMFSFSQFNQPLDKWDVSGVKYMYGMFMNNFDKLYYKLKEEKLFDLLYDMIDYYETKNYIFTHGFIPVLGEENFKYNPLWREVDKLEFYKARWLNGPEMSIKYGIGERSKKIIIGHKCIERARILKGEDKNDLSIYEDDNIILLDAHTVISNQLNILVIEEE
jgi:hypothetical protein